jgi:hypothetical protein
VTEAPPTPIPGTYLPPISARICSRRADLHGPAGRQHRRSEHRRALNPIEEISLVISSPVPWTRSGVVHQKVRTHVRPAIALDPDIEMAIVVDITHARAVGFATGTGELRESGGVDRRNRVGEARSTSTTPLRDRS